MIQAIVFLPLLAAILVGMNTRSLSAPAAQWITCLAVGLAAIFSWITFYDVVLQGNAYTVDLLQWMQSGLFSAKWALKVDSLTALMLTLVTTVSALVHMYSVGYMSHDTHRQRFMAYLSLFTFFMLMLVTSDNFIQLYLGWEGVGLASYLLIGFWYNKPTANAAAIKAFVVNRVGDFGLALGIFACFMLFGSVEFDTIFANVAAYKDATFSLFDAEIHAITLICILLFIGCMGKSAQLFLHTWLPDAMEGPTPVSALIHAATMVTAGIFLVARCSPLFEAAPVARDMVTYIGAATCLFAATIALTQHDIKRVIAYSTCSQLGYMFFACGISAYGAGMFHLYTHGFFKALLFLGAGSVIHAMSDEQDMRKMGGIWKKIPFTYAMMLIGTLAITGFPLLSGYYSKDMILEAAYAAGHTGQYGAAKHAYWLGITAALLTAFYSWRLIFMTFHGKSRASKKVLSHVHESPKIMTIPLLILAVGAIFVGAIFAKQLGIVSEGQAFWNNSVEEGVITRNGATESIYEAVHHVPAWVVNSPKVAGAVGFLVALLSYIFVPALPAMAAKWTKPLYVLFSRKWFFDEIYHYVFVVPTFWLGRILWKQGDENCIDRYGPNGVSKLSLRTGGWVNRLQSGLVYNYAFIILIGLLIFVTWIIISFARKGV